MLAPRQGLPDQWSSLLQVSGISKTEIAKNPQGMLDVLGFYTEGQEQKSGGAGAAKEEKYIGFEDEDTGAAGKQGLKLKGNESPARPAPPTIPDRPKHTIGEKTVPVKAKAAPPATPPRQPAPATPKADGGDDGVARRGGGKKKKMSDDEVMTKLREIVSPAISQERYTNKIKIGQGASGTVCVHPPLFPAGMSEMPFRAPSRLRALACVRRSVRQEGGLVADTNGASAGAECGLG